MVSPALAGLVYGLFLSVSFLAHVLKNILSIAEPPLWVPLASGLLVATGWYSWGYTRRAVSGRYVRLHVEVRR